MVEASSSTNCLAALDLLPDAALSLLASHWGEGAIDAHACRSSLLVQLRQQLQQTELDPTLEPSLLPQLQLPALFGFSAAVYNDNIYVYGGRSSSDTASSGVRSHLYCYDTVQQKWVAVKQYHAPAPRRWHTSVVHGECMYIYGGQTWDEARGEWEACSAFSCYCFSTCSWSETAQAGCGPSCKAKRAAAAVGPTLYVLPAPHAAQAGASQGYNMLHSFDLENGCWSMRVCFGPDIPDCQQLQLEQLLHRQGSLLAVFSCNPAAAAASASLTHPSPQQQQQHLSVYSLSLGELRWHKLATHGAAPVSRTQSCIALLDDLLLVSGGARPGTAGAEQALLPDLAFLHLPSKKWHALQLPASSKPARACHAAAAMPGGASICLLDGDAFAAHRFILASQSPVFEAMLQPGGMSEAASGCVALPDISSAALEALLGYVYGGLPGGVPRELVLPLFSAADRFLLPGLAGECVLQLLGCLSAENVSLVADLASTHRLQDLWQACVAYAASPEVQLQVFNSAAYAAMWSDSPATAQAFTSQVVALSQKALSRMKQQLPAAAAGAAGNDTAGCLLPPLQQVDVAAAEEGTLGQHARGVKRHRTE
ncbi:hypothetical protein OEZ85_006310 [Tetradesmus obliquus]|uniref:BTB domain-containing protein n=1 Tax=Tetradesmus obliquus TaxID=3088 RepID=A0ABY8TYY1_TETOB|nr:hypothetical protein OEZ85_006310 [Tetradesmus obliquus]